MGSSIRTFEFSGKTAGPHLLITGGVHGDEFEPIAAIQKLVEMFSKVDSMIANLCGRVTLVPCVNEEAFQLGRRCAADNLDLARTCPGREQGTITETTAFALSELIRSADYYIDLHTGGTEFSIYPLAGYMLHADQDVLDKQRAMAKAFNLNVTWGTSPDLEGRSLSVARDANVPAIYCEYLGAATCSAEGVEAYVSGCLNVMSALGMIPQSQQSSLQPENREYFVEDKRPSSGHLQVCQPSPVDGLFAPKVQLGDKIQQGDIFGIVSALDDSQPAIIFAEETGIVLMIRTFPRVHTGESVGVVLKVESSPTDEGSGYYTRQTFRSP